MDDAIMTFEFHDESLHGCMTSPPNKQVDVPCIFRGTSDDKSDEMGRVVRRR